MPTSQSPPSLNAIQPRLPFNLACAYACLALEHRTDRIKQVLAAETVQGTVDEEAKHEQGVVTSHRLSASVSDGLTIGARPADIPPLAGGGATGIGTSVAAAVTGAATLPPQRSRAGPGSPAATDVWGKTSPGSGPTRSAATVYRRRRSSQFRPARPSSPLCRFSDNSLCNLPSPEQKDAVSPNEKKRWRPSPYDRPAISGTSRSGGRVGKSIKKPPPITVSAGASPGSPLPFALPTSLSPLHATAPESPATYATPPEQLPPWPSPGTI